ncbi:S-layer homology domain-containing protein [Metasolibacillus meyeri]|uniref:S-layer homology domain-containing protein n=1 Tax=Metasolibacillus meyeri TaxID=1071052 RepID=A0AAW9NXN2_9BACL|nr:S-layer homology domain-containing protein [Metasolibacillus meyeri]MEC1179560.1 S-layer homology domain-containing protein [Metasolibacillus meyeri]
MKQNRIAKALLLSAAVSLVAAPVSYAADTPSAKQQAEAVEAKINSLTNNSTAEQVNEVRQAYNALSSEAQALVASEALNKLRAAEARIQNAQEQAEKKAKEDAWAIEAMINRLTYSSSKEAVFAVKNAYDGLSVLAKGYVSNSSYLYLTRLLQEIAKQEAAIAAAKASAAAFDRYMVNVTRQSSGTVLANARSYYNRLSYEAKQYVTTLSKLERLEQAYGKNPSGPPKQPTHPNTKQEDLTGIVGTDSKSKPVPLSYIPDNEFGTVVSGSTDLQFVRSGDELFAYIPSDIIYYQQEPITITASNGVNVKLPITDLKGLSGTVAVSLTIENDKFYFSVRSRGNDVTFRDYAEIVIPKKELKVSTNAIIYQTEGKLKRTRVPLKVEKDAFVVKTKTSGDFVASTIESAVNYSDIAGDPNAHYINELGRRGVLTGASGSSYLPTKSVTRADFAVMLARAASLTSSSPTPFNDVRGKAYAKEVQALHEKGIMPGSGRVYYNANGQMTRQQAAVILDRYLAYLGVDVYQISRAGNLHYTDVYMLTEAEQKSIALMDTLDIFTPSANGEFRPHANLTRSEMARILYITMELADLL